MIDDIQHSRYKTECHWYSSNVNFWYSKCNLGWISTKKSRYLPNTVITPVPYPRPSPLVFSQTRKQILLLKRQTFTLQCLANFTRTHKKEHYYVKPNPLLPEFEEEGWNNLAYPLDLGSTMKKTKLPTKNW